uniref:ORF23 n=1 Tax=Latid herpesvirus 1 TaxID=3096545 RepID=A0AB33V9A9_9VIRU
MLATRSRRSAASARSFISASSRARLSRSRIITLCDTTASVFEKTMAMFVCEVSCTVNEIEWTAINVAALTALIGGQELETGVVPVDANNRFELPGSLVLGPVSGVIIKGEFVEGIVTNNLTENTVHQWFTVISSPQVKRPPTEFMNACGELEEMEAFVRQGEQMFGYAEEALWAAAALHAFIPAFVEQRLVDSVTDYPPWYEDGDLSGIPPGPRTLILAAGRNALIATADPGTETRIIFDPEEYISRLRSATTTELSAGLCLGPEPPSRLSLRTYSVALARTGAGAVDVFLILRDSDESRVRPRWWVERARYRVSSAMGGNLALNGVKPYADALAAIAALCAPRR